MDDCRTTASETSIECWERKRVYDPLNPFPSSPTSFFNTLCLFCGPFSPLFHFSVRVPTTTEKKVLLVHGSSNSYLSLLHSVIFFFLSLENCFQHLSMLFRVLLCWPTTVDGTEQNPRTLFLALSCFPMCAPPHIFRFFLSYIGICSWPHTTPCDDS